MKLTITEKDQATAERYIDNENCLVATLLKRAGYKQVSVLPTFAFADGKTFEILDSCRIEKFYTKNSRRVLKSAIGKKIELAEVRR